MNARSCLPLPLALVALAGCGGGGGGSHNSSTSPFAGAYSGTYAETSPTASGTTGTLSIVVANDGTMTGSGTDSDFSGVAGTLTSGSKITSGGGTTLKVTYVDNGSTVTNVLTGTLTLTSATTTTLTGNLTTTLSGTTTTFSVTLTEGVAG